MPFPTTPILDDFNSGASQALTARTGWGATVFGGGVRGTYSTNGTPTVATSAAIAGNFWNDSSVDCECYFTVAAFDNVNDTMKVAARITVAGSSPTFYAVECDFGTTTDFQIVKYIAGGRTALGANPATTVVANDGVGISVIGNVITAYYRSGLGGSWVQKDSVTDSAITGSGFIGGFQHDFAFTHSIDGFGGGVPVANSPLAGVNFQRKGDRRA